MLYSLFIPMADFLNQHCCVLLPGVKKKGLSSACRDAPDLCQVVRELHMPVA
ncbi:hypothetical protein DPMN_147030 [Dreissena polymorpha]|uniref:Uncharacterized protein n=1 Tax=Dreissena polymorpha TaxID=45954 RepID=A0A9D4F930_DREPO|nr:hypothetical protein DPMN_147030 [Dreissena polymorpha]